MAFEITGLQFASEDEKLITSRAETRDAHTDMYRAIRSTSVSHKISWSDADITAGGHTKKEFDFFQAETVDVRPHTTLHTPSLTDERRDEELQCRAVFANEAPIIFHAEATDVHLHTTCQTHTAYTATVGVMFNSQGGDRKRGLYCPSCGGHDYAHKESMHQDNTEEHCSEKVRGLEGFVYYHLPALGADADAAKRPWKCGRSVNDAIASHFQKGTYFQRAITREVIDTLILQSAAI